MKKTDYIYKLWAIEDKKGNLVEWSNDPRPLLVKTKKEAQFRIDICGMKKYARPVKVEIRKVKE